jgi:hypothetical protein
MILHSSDVPDSCSPMLESGDFSSSVKSRHRNWTENQGRHIAYAVLPVDRQENFGLTEGKDGWIERASRRVTYYANSDG